MVIWQYMAMHNLTNCYSAVFVSSNTNANANAKKKAIKAHYVINHNPVANFTTVHVGAKDLYEIDKNQ